jgi:hypothetical protein
MKRTIQDLIEKIKGVTRRLQFRPRALPTLPNEAFIGIIIILVAFGSFGLGRLSRIEGARTPIRIENAPKVTTETFTQKTTVADAGGSVPLVKNNSSQLVGSKNGKKYYYTWCSGVSRIAEGNRIYFETKADAEARGYTPSSTCKGL